MVTCAVFAIGNELLEGSILDTNSAYISSRLNTIGLDVQEIRSLPDNEISLVEILISAQIRYEVIFTTGGLGPTFDDITASAVSKATDRACVFNDQAYKHIEKVLTSKNVALKETHRTQAFLPIDSILFHNAVGTAYGFAVDTVKSVIISLPGVPAEMNPMFDVYIIPFLKKRFLIEPRYSTVMHFAGIPESDVDEHIRKIGLSDDLKCTINATQGEILVRIQSSDPKILSQFDESLRTRFEASFISSGNESVAETLLKLLKSEKETLAVAESLTGGQIGQYISAIPGASDVFIGGLIGYSNWAKIKHLEVPHEVILKNGPVSYECAIAMVRNVSRLFETEAAISVTGIAGPTGGSVNNPVGTVFIGMVYRNQVNVKRFVFSGNRDTIRERTVKTAITQLIKLIRKTRQSD